MTNTSGIVPTEYKVLIRPKAVEEVTKGGILLPDQKKDSDKFSTDEGTIVAVSPLAFTYARPEEWEAAGAVPPKSGDYVIFAKFSGLRRKGADGLDYVLVNDKDIVAIVS